MLNGISNISSQNTTCVLEQQVTLPEFRKTSDCLNNIFSEIKNYHNFDADCESAKHCAIFYCLYIIESCELPGFCCSDNNDSQITLF